MVSKQAEKPKHLFERVSYEKQERIIHCCIEEFANAGFEKASTGNIAKNAGIAKGSLFKYFGTKEHMYYHMAEHVIKHYYEYLMSGAVELPEGLLDRFMAMQAGMFKFFSGNRIMFKFYMQLQTSGAPMMEELRAKWSDLGKPLMEKFFEGADTSKLAISVEELSLIIQWLDYAVDSEVLADAGKDTTPEELAAKHDNRLKLVYKILKNGIYKKEKK